MHIELLTIGTELVLGFTTDTNGAYLGRRLAEEGVRVARRTSVGDDPAAIRDALRHGLSRTGFVVTTGGLGPTRDDLTKKVVADLFGVPLDFQTRLWDELVARFARFGRVPAESNRCQAEVPRGATVLPNRRGTAPGLWLHGELGEVVMLPGVPAELRGLVDEEVIPRLKQRTGGAGAPVRSLVLRTTAIPESTLAERLRPIEDGLGPLTLAYLPSVEGVDLRLTAWGLAPERSSELFARAEAAIRPLLGDHCYGSGDDDLARLLLNELRARGLGLAVAESCTGGMVGERITAVPGSSAVFRGGVIAYSDDLKTDLLAVPIEVLRSQGAVSEATARHMAAGARDRTGAAVSVAVTGIAGPDGGTAEKPVGTVWFGFAVTGRVETQRVGFPGERHDVRARAAQFALWGLWRRVRTT
jgi:nicotinamide-nucleotide amidase